MTGKLALCAKVAITGHAHVRLLAQMQVAVIVEMKRVLERLLAVLALEFSLIFNLQFTILN
jgi:hypothetical protein